jgi:alpha-D-ribose 1-methylphosphonate 5-phosphate C-P lyase
MKLAEWREQYRGGHDEAKYAFAYLDEGPKREMRRKMLKAVAIPGYQVPFGSRDMPVARGWGTGGMQVTLSIVLSEDVLKVIDQGSDESVNAVNIREFVQAMTDVSTTVDTTEASIVQTRHRIPEERLRADQILVLQVPEPEPLRRVEPSERRTRRYHAEEDYSRIWLHLYEDIVQYKEITIGAMYPVRVNGRYVMDPSPIPRWDIHHLNNADHLSLFCAGREKRIYAVPPHTRVEPLEFEDHRFRVEDFSGLCCEKCGSTDTYLDELIDDTTGRRMHTCSDTSFCLKRRRAVGAWT